ncbi:TVP38/TMEM64 family protein [Macrococcus hajekii]|uniref:TVP38/TMEM64 family membrane protein n=1 Tax=Macrococcus hajekii TaxID=198482 RepID=A0A4R6BNV3_9STAP|nr:TVP38/TMEM64 family protein [Macrococcus hajekii]TDM03458.1 TVP38/TMEM64 family protein [Macrococcus hajekii]GGA99050.1 putative membrane protein YhjE [Macrococcus hajekii]
MLHDLLSPDYLQQWVQHHPILGIFIGFLLPFIEAFLPVLPIIAFAVVNVNAFGLLPGFFITWSGAVAGAYSVFLLIRRFGQHRFVERLNKHPYVKKMMWRINEQGVLPLFILLCFPFTPSSLINIVGALSNIRQHRYLAAVMAGKAVMLLLLSYIGADLKSFITQPVKTVIVICLLLLLWLIGKKVEDYYERKGK